MGVCASRYNTHPLKMRLKQARKRKKIKIETTRLFADFQPGNHKHTALQKHQGFVKPKMAKKLEKTEKWIKKRNYGEIKSVHG
jgi:hypothetical protein